MDSDGHRADPSDRSSSGSSSVASATQGGVDKPAEPEHGLVGDVVFDPPLTPEERRQVGVGIPIEERIEQARRQIADGSAWD